MHEIGVVAVVSAGLATLWNYLFNLGFDRIMLRWFGNVRKSLRTRIVHALLFEGGLLVALLPFIAWYLGISLVEALLMDLSFAVFYVVFAFAFNWAYDIVFPVPQPGVPQR
jgi:uncharacterized membrane protein